MQTVKIAVGVCFVCSILVCTAAVGLESKQTANKTLDKTLNILKAGDLYEEDIDPIKVYEENIKTDFIELETGTVLKKDQYTDMINPKDFDIKKAAMDDEYGIAIDPDKDLAGIKRRPKYMQIYEVLGKEDNIEKYIFPVYGKGLWSTMYGFLAISNDLQTIEGITFYEHGETPGLGGEIENPRWQGIWKGKKAFNDQGQVIIEVIKGQVDQSSPAADHQIDGLSGSTLTTRGLDNTIKYWLGEDGYGPYIENLRKGAAHEEK
jgi:Na+-transporting NADH:ubiquinone oxidoreductase subunit C